MKDSHAMRAKINERIHTSRDEQHRAALTIIEAVGYNVHEAVDLLNALGLVEALKQPPVAAEAAAVLRSEARRYKHLPLKPGRRLS